jgi:hypothetical protein
VNVPKLLRHQMTMLKVILRCPASRSLRGAGLSSYLLTIPEIQRGE